MFKEKAISLQKESHRDLISDDDASCQTVFQIFVISKECAPKVWNGNLFFSSSFVSVCLTMLSTGK